ncbi:uncharacterized protein YecE (DUF72 family) [Pseudorhizobium tarimense]|uniref:Uncharacterized protein YecE (DUF72 family) n=1 Tax=Pseudorhizobium tarimense TaxID=1079109 RepID=A0ABV2HCE8_9HYPH|nr:DUF72 domain-containing protein [Pseudorhizobium tarimense]MCJ8521277.1 DUF72 domain-containing protein [Pseudorhizobium tarimense]
MTRTGTIRIGISGWTYKPWRRVFYPVGLPQKQELCFAASHFPSIEINGTFYSLQMPQDFTTWREATPDDFVFSVKGPRFITHMKRLKEIEIPLANYLASGLLNLRHKLGPILWQFPPRMKFDAGRFENFLKILPKETDEAVALAKRHDSRLDGRSATETDKNRLMRHAFEIRHESFACDEFIELLRCYGAALVVADTVQWPLLMDLTADFVYCRLHGSEELYVSGYDEGALDVWAALVRSWAAGKDPQQAKRVLPPSPDRSSGRDVYVYFDNDAKVRAPADAASLITRLN